MGIISRIIKKIRIKFMSKESYLSYLRKSGLQIGNNCEIYKSANFGSEPYLITLGDHVRINSGVTFVTHDGGGMGIKRFTLRVHRLL